MSSEGLREEIEVLQAILNNNIKVLDELTIVYEGTAFILRIELPNEYPSGCGKIKINLNLRKSCAYDLSEKFTYCLSDAERLASERDGAPIIFDIIELFRSVELENIYTEPVQAAPSIPQEPIEESATNINIQDDRVSIDNTDECILEAKSIIFRSELITEKKSVFLGSCCRVYSHEEIEHFRAAVLSNKKVASATHNIFAYSFVNEAGVCAHDNDDDGESAAGGRLAELLQRIPIQNVAVIVTRWFGGVLLGPDRFKYINMAARDAIDRMIDSESMESKGLVNKGNNTALKKKKKK